MEFVIPMSYMLSDKLNRGFRAFLSNEDGFKADYILNFQIERLIVIKGNL